MSKISRIFAYYSAHAELDAIYRFLLALLAMIPSLAVVSTFVASCLNDPIFVDVMLALNVAVVVTVGFLVIRALRYRRNASMVPLVIVSATALTCLLATSWLGVPLTPATIAVAGALALLSLLLLLMYIANKNELEQS